MSNYCYRCNRTHPMERMVVVANVYRDGSRWLDVDVGCIRLGDRVIDTLYDEDEIGPDSAQELLERGPR